MCPLCIGTGAMLLSSGTCAGGLAGLVLKLRSRGGRGAGSTSHRVGIPPDPFEGQPPCVRRNELVNGVGSPGSGLV
jgi:hypothetical protein